MADAGMERYLSRSHPSRRGLSDRVLALVRHSLERVVETLRRRITSDQ
jgi:hypothetical protein